MPSVFYIFHTTQKIHLHHYHHPNDIIIIIVIMPHIYPLPCNKPIRNKLQRRRVIPHRLITHFLCFKVVRRHPSNCMDIFQSLFTHFLCFKMIRNKFKGVITFDSFYTHLLRPKAKRNMMQQLWTCLNRFLTHFLFFLKWSGTPINKIGFLRTSSLIIS